MARDPSFAPPGHQLGVPSLGAISVAAAPSGGQGLALDATGQIPAGLATTVIGGQVDSTGAINAGTGFTVDKTGTGTYDIVFDSPFAATPTVVACATTNNIVAVTAADETGFTVTAFSADRDFNFVAVPQ